MSQTLVKLTIKSDVGEFTAPINPSSYNYNLGIEYTETIPEAVGGLIEVKYVRTKPQEMSFDF